ncbi:MAG: ADP-ribosylglycohydrolase family protein [Candidatus Accumulibacter sp.]|jgi:ADP-ribosylglycohydrolase|nr:ADP-ribosylglycohydrolase family protein [Accumulibacter sp.]
MLGAIIGDICGSIYEFDNHKTDRPKTIDLLNPGCFYTDDTVLTCAVAEALFGFGEDDRTHDYGAAIYRWANKYPGESYGGNFRHWFASSNPQPYNSYGNGSAMRVSPVGWAFDSLEETLAEAKKSADVTHNHPDGVKGAQATAAAIFMARKGASKQEIKTYTEKTFGYDLNRRSADIRPIYEFNESCQGTVPEAIIAFLESDDYPSAIQIAISLGGDTDTLACITGGIAEAFYRKIPKEITAFAKGKLDENMVRVIDKFYNRFG